MRFYSVHLTAFLAVSLDVFWGTWAYCSGFLFYWVWIIAILDCDEISLDHRDKEPSEPLSQE